MLRQGSALLHQLLSVVVIPSETTVLSPLKRQEESFRYVLVMLLASVTTSMAWRSGMMNIVRLQKSLGNGCLNWGSMSMNRLLLWVLMYGSVIAAGTLREEWFVQRALQLATRLEYHDIHEINNITAQYFYANELQYHSMRKLATRITPRHSTPLPVARVSHCSMNHSLHLVNSHFQKRQQKNRVLQRAINVLERSVISITTHVGQAPIYQPDLGLDSTSFSTLSDRTVPRPSHAGVRCLQTRAIAHMSSVVSHILVSRTALRIEMTLTSTNSPGDCIQSVLLLQK
jgi:hypothetical protein